MHWKLQKKILNEQPDITAIMCGNDQMAVAAKTALNLAGNDQTVVYSIDSSPDIKKLKRQIVRLQEPLHSRRSTSERKRLILHWIFWRERF